jgi:hypothetical protein
MKIWRYSVPNVNHSGWAICFIDQAGCLAILSDYGNYAYRWPAGGIREFPDLRHFLLKCSGDDYLISKLASRSQYSPEKTCVAIKEAIAGITNDVERAKEQRHLEDNDDVEDESDFVDWCEETSFDCPWEFRCDDYCSDARAFMKQSWPRLLEQIREDIGKTT